MKTITNVLSGFPPIVMRALARAGRGQACRLLSDKEVASGSGLPIGAIKRISQLTTWDSITVSDADKFMVGCRCTLDRIQYHRAYLKRTLGGGAVVPMSFAAKRRTGPQRRGPTAAMLVKAAVKPKGKTLIEVFAEEERKGKQ